LHNVPTASGTEDSPAPDGNRPGAVSIRVNAQRLQLEMARRGLSAEDLAREAKLSPQTVRVAMAAEAIAMASFKCIAAAIERIPVITAAELLLGLNDESDELT